MSSQTHSYIRELEILRGIAASAVFVAHFAQLHWDLTTLHFPGRVASLLGVWGVAIFFVLSGYVIHSNTIASERSFGAINWRIYFARRVLRIVPAYWVAVLIYYALGMHYQSNMISQKGGLDLLLHLAFLSSYSSSHFESINSIFWTVVVEMHFYAVYPIIYGAAKRFGYIPVFLGTLGAGALGFLLVAAAFEPGLSRVAFQHLPILLLWKWMLGVMLAQYSAELRAVRIIQRRALVYSVVVFGVLAAPLITSDVIALQYSRFVLPIFCGLHIFILSTKRPRRGLQARARHSASFGELLGKLSYSVYLWHPAALLYVAVSMNLARPLENFGVSVALTALFAIASFKIIEKPFLSLGARISRG